MSIRIAINGFGRIGRNIVRALYQQRQSNPYSALEIVAINDLGPANTNAHLLEFDSVHGRFNGTVAHDDEHLFVNGDSIKLLQQRDPSKLPWGELNIDLVLECTGLFTKREQSEAHINAGAGKVIISAPGTSLDATIVYGVNHETLTGNERIISNASCTTNCLAPMAKILNDAFGIDQGQMTTIHSYTNDQNLIDNFHKGNRRGRSAALNMVLTETGAVKAVGKVLPALMGKLSGNAIRVPTPNVSMAILNLTLKRETTADELNEYIRKVSVHSPLRKQIDFTNSPEVVSTDFVGSRRACVFDAQATIVNGKNAVLYIWYDNEFGYTCQVHRVMEKMAGVKYAMYPAE